MREVAVSWYAVYTRPNVEAKVYSHLRDLGFQAFFPYYVEQRKTAQKGRVRAIALPFYPRYLFVDCAENHVSEYVLRCPEVTAVLGAPTPIEDVHVERLQRLAQPNGEMLPRKYRRSRYKKGDRLVVEDVENLLYGREITFTSMARSGIIRAELEKKVTISIREDQVRKKEEPQQN